MTHSPGYGTPDANDTPGTRDAGGIPQYYLGVDGGGTKTLAIVVDAQGQERGRGLAGGANYNAVGLDQAIQHIHAAVEQAAHAAGCRLPLHKAWLGLAGVDRPYDYEALLPLLRSLAERVHMTNDADLVLSALEETVGVVLIAGTGSIALGRDARGTSRRAGGWGHVIGDEGSGYEMGRLGLQAAVRAVDGRGPRTTLLQVFMERWRLDNANDIVGYVYADEDKAKIARLATDVLTAARAGDEVAETIVRHAADELALAVSAVSNALDFPQRIPLALGGGLLLHNPDFRAQVLHLIRQQQPIGEVVLVEEPALSAARAIIR
nr:BadF/BadG/BcrA/BcrD type ATPase [Ktedonobacteraceae bacterium]